MAEAEEDEAMLAELFAHLEELKQEAKRHELEALLSGELDKNDAYLEVHAGSGGTEAPGLGGNAAQNVFALGGKTQIQTFVC